MQGCKGLPVFFLKRDGCEIFEGDFKYRDVHRFKSWSKGVVKPCKMGQHQGNKAAQPEAGGVCELGRSKGCG